MTTDRTWQFWIDVGGTFTDCIACAPTGALRTLKVLSSGVTKGKVLAIASDGRAIVDPARSKEPTDFWLGYQVRLFDRQGQTLFATQVTRFDRRRGMLELKQRLPEAVGPGATYELTAGEEAPILAIRLALGLKRDDPIPPCSVRLGTTRGTNALLTRQGARTAFITTKGFGDVLLIGNQTRPKLFELVIRKPQPLFERVVEIDERIDAEGRVLVAPDETAIRRQLHELKQAGIESVAICLLHSFTNSRHEELVERITRDVGFAEISVSSKLSPLIKIVSRGDTTLMNAYLNPVLRDYMLRMRRTLENARETVADEASQPASSDLSGQSDSFDGTERSGRSTLKIMTSAGGLVDAEHFVGKDSILSGPAGGVIGFSRVAQRAGFSKSIGFDMGGTSTDVSRFDGQYEREFETEKAGVRVVAPMLAIETVAAGGGSICGFDGVKLFVGPQSAGADPGPACYGRGGPLTVTDVNLFLGKIPPARFPFPLDRAAVEDRLSELCDRIAASPLGQRYQPVELAQGFCDIANHNMVRAIRKISVARGYDPADYVLVTFGGAGAQHACAIAEQLGIRRILIHPYAGILSAYGMGLADVRRFGERAVLKPYSEQTLVELEPVFARLESDVRAHVLREGIPPERIHPPIRSLEMRYSGVEATIVVARPEDGNYARQYELLHQQLYGYTHSGRELEIVAARVEIVGTMPEPPERTVEPIPRRPSPRETTTTWFAGRPHPTPVFLRADLHPGDQLTGPAIVCEPTSTVVIDPGFEARLLERGEILIEVAGRRVRGAEKRVQGGQRPEPRDEGTTPTEQQGARAGRDDGHVRAGRRRSTSNPRRSACAPEPAAPDPVLLEIFNNLFASIAEQMGVTLQKTSFSTNVKERLDFSCALFDPQGNLVVNAPHIPVHLGAMSETVKRILADNPDMKPGDVFVTNDPYRGGSHLPDVTVITPVHHAASGELLFFTASRAHHAEIGGVAPGSMPPFSRNLAEEGVLIRNFKLVDGGAAHDDELRRILTSGPYPTRAVRDNLADIAAQVAANNSGVRQLNELVQRYTLPVVQAYMKHIQQAASEKMRLALAALPDGSYRFADHLDDGSPIRVTITIRGSQAKVDFTGTGPVVPGNLNANRAIVTAAVLYVFRCLINEDIPLNSGVLEPVEIVLPECLLNPPERAEPSQCAAVVGGNVETSQRVVDVLLGALGAAAASQGTMNNLSFGDATFGYYETICGGAGATPDADGADAVHTHMTNTRLTDVEVIERRYPVRVVQFSIRRGSGGHGARRGGDGVVRRIEFLKPLKVSILSQRRGPYPPFGLAGGQPGELGRNRLRRAGSDRDELLGGRVELNVHAGDLLTIETPGGGGYGRPSD